MVIFFYFVIGHIVAPISGMPGWLTALALYGYKVFFILYFANLVSSAVNFWISRKFGRPWVEKFCNKRTMQKIDKYSERLGDEALIVLRIAGFSLFDVISYAAGFTKMSFKRYYFITATCSAIPLGIFAVFFSRFTVTTLSMTVLIAIVLIFAGVIAYLAHRKMN